MPPKKTGFHVNRCKFGMTWSCPKSGDCKDMPKMEHADNCACSNPIPSCQHVLEEMREHGIVDEYIVSEEKHANGTLHYHAYIKFADAVESKNCRVFDIFGVHCNVNKPGKGWKTYVAKAGEYITNFYEDSDVFAQAMRLGGVEGMQLIQERKPRDYMLNKEKYAKSLFRPYSGAREIVWLWGPAGSGKTRTAVQAGAQVMTASRQMWSYELDAENDGKIVCMDEIDKALREKDVTFTQLLVMTDVNAVKCRVPNAVWMPWCAEKIYLTSTVDPALLMDELGHVHGAEQIIRRCSQIIHLE